MAYYFGQDIATKLAAAEVYFGVTMHLRAYDWAAFETNEKKAALNQAEREINAHLGTDLEELYDTTEFPISELPNFRPDYACFEHAFYLLNNLARAKSSTTAVEMIESEQYQREERTIGVGIAPEALVFLRLNRLQIERG